MSHKYRNLYILFFFFAVCNTINVLIYVITVRRVPLHGGEHVAGVSTVGQQHLSVLYNRAPSFLMEQTMNMNIWGFRFFTVQQQMYDWKYFNPAAALQTSPDLLSVFFLHSLTLIHPNSTCTHIHTISMFQNAWWPIYYWRGTPTDKQIPRNEVIWPGHVYTNTAEGFYG